VHPLEIYLRDLSEAHAAGVPETTHYPGLRTLFNEIGSKLKPKVRCIINPKDEGAGIPDGGLYTPDQLPKSGDPEPPLDTLPARGAIEAKPTNKDAFEVAKSEQVAKYLKRYRQVLVTNFRDFVLVGLDGDGKRRILESYRLAKDEESFWNAAAHPRAIADREGERFADFLRRVILHAAELAQPKDVAAFLASYAREARWRVERHDLAALAPLREALEQALGLKFEGSEGEHFFRSTLVQTLFYGAFAAWVLWSKEHPPSDRKAQFDWRLAGYHLHVPIVSVLFHQLIEPTQLKTLGVDEVLDWAGDVLNRIDRASFFEAFEEPHAVQYFYEPFLEEYDPALRKQLGVWYTPPEIVTYMVERVDSVLRSEFNIADGLADPRVYVLDPCCGTGSYVVEVLRRIEKTLTEKGKSALTANAIKKAAMERVFGFEIMPAPYVISHLQVGIALQQSGAPLASDGTERAGVFLTNSLTGWEPPTGPKQHIFAFPQLEAERDAADLVKRTKPILVILGNPPYNAFAGVSPAEEMGLVELYKKGLVTDWKIKKFNLDDLYIRFFRIAERRITEGEPGAGIVAFISNFSYIEDASLVVVRKRYVNEFDRIWVDCMNGDSRETGKLTPEGKPDPSIFSTVYNREGIRVGTAIGIMARAETRAQQAQVLFREFWGVSKRADLVESLKASDFDGQYEPASPEKANRYSFRPSKVSAEYSKWPKIIDLCAMPPGNGLMEKRGGALIDIDRVKLEKRMRAYFDRKLDWTGYLALGHRLTEKQAGFDPKTARRKVLEAEAYDANRIVRYALRPFDLRWCYYTAVPPVWNRARLQLWAQCRGGNEFLMTRPAGVASPEGVPFHFTRYVGDNDFLRGHAYYFPIRLKGQVTRANLGPTIRAYLKEINLASVDTEPSSAAMVWMHALALGYSLKYLAENADGIRRDWPRIPLPDSKEALMASAELGSQIAALLDTESAVPGVTTAIRPELAASAVISREGGGSLDPNKGDLALTAGWGHAGKDGAVMPGKGRIVERDYSTEESKAIEAGAAKLGTTDDGVIELLGKRTNDVYLNGIAYWKNIPAGVWEYTIGGYQVIKKWLSYRDRDLLMRDMTPEEVEEVSAMARRIAAIILLGPALDANYVAVKKSTYKWPEQAIQS
jgi:hypothetical protein